MSIPIPPPPPRDENEARQQIAMLEKRIRNRQIATYAMLATFIVTCVIIAIMFYGS